MEFFCGLPAALAPGDRSSAGEGGEEHGEKAFGEVVDEGRVGDQGGRSRNGGEDEGQG